MPEIHKENVFCQASKSNLILALGGSRPEIDQEEKKTPVSLGNELSNQIIMGSKQEVIPELVLSAKVKLRYC